MRQRLVIRLNTSPQGRVHWIRLDGDGRTEGHAESGTLEAAAGIASSEQRQVVALAPANSLLLLSARIPTQSRQRLLQAIPFALEDQVADDIANLHFAVGRRNAEGDIAVAVIAHEHMRGWQSAFDEIGLEVEQIYPEILALPYEEGAWTLMVEGDGFLLRSGPQSGFAGDRDYLEVLLAAAISDAGEHGPQRIIAYSAEGPVTLESIELPLENRELIGTTALLATSLDEREAIPLQVGPYARRRGSALRLGRWKIPAALLAAWVIVDTGGAWLERWSLQRELSAVNAQITQTFRSAFPGRGPILNPRQQMESRLAALRGRSTQGGALRLIDTVGSVIATDRSIQLTTLNFRNGSLDLEMTAPNLQAIDQMARRLGEVQGIRVEVTRASTEGDRAVGRLRVEGS